MIVGKSSLYQIRCDIYDPSGKWVEIIEAETKTTESIRSKFREVVDRLAAAIPLEELPVISAITKNSVSELTSPVEPLKDAISKKQVNECAVVKCAVKEGDRVKLDAAWMDKCAANVTSKKIKKDYEYKTEQDLICQVTWASPVNGCICVARNGNGVFVPAGFFHLLVETEAGITVLEEERWNPALSGEVSHKIEASGQISVFWDDSDEPPDPDDYLTLDDYHQAWGIWSGSFPELALAVLEHPQVVISPAPELKTQNSGAGWVEQYTVTKDPNGNQYHYYRYCWREKGKIRHYHIAGGNARSQLVMERVQAIRDAIAEGKTHFNIENWIKGGFGKSGYRL